MSRTTRREDKRGTLLLTEADKVVGPLHDELLRSSTLILFDHPHASAWLHTIDTKNINDAVSKDEVRAIKEAYEGVRGALFAEARRVIEEEVGDPIYKALMYMQMHPREGQEFPKLSDILVQYPALELYQRNNISAAIQEVYGRDILADENRVEVEKLAIKLDWLERVQQVCGDFDHEYRNICSIAQGRC